MEPIAIVGMMTSVIPFVTAAVKRFFTKKMTDKYRSGVNAVIPIVLGIVSVGLYTYRETNDVWLAVAAGLGSGGAASSARDIDKNLTRIIETAYGLVQSKKKAA